MRCTTCIKDPVLTSVHYVRHWPSVAINSMLIIPQASGNHTSLALVKIITKTEALNAYWVSNHVGF